MALPSRIFALLAVFVVLVSIVLSSPSQDIESPNFVPLSGKILRKSSESRSTNQLNSRQQRTIMMASIMDQLGVGDMGNRVNWANLFNLNGTQFSWVPLGSLLFNMNSNSNTGTKAG